MNLTPIGSGEVVEYEPFEIKHGGVERTISAHVIVNLKALVIVEPLGDNSGQGRTTSVLTALLLAIDESRPDEVLLFFAPDDRLEYFDSIGGAVDRIESDPAMQEVADMAGLSFERVPVH